MYHNDPQCIHIHTYQCKRNNYNMNINIMYLLQYIQAVYGFCTTVAQGDTPISVVYAYHPPREQCGSWKSISCMTAHGQYIYYVQWGRITIELANIQTYWRLI